MTHIVRAFVIALTLTGAAASIHSSNAFASPVKQPKPTGLPVPLCAPSDPTCQIVVSRW